jgi:hypothetical protein
MIIDSPKPKTMRVNDKVVVIAAGYAIIGTIHVIGWYA